VLQVEEVCLHSYYFFTAQYLNFYIFMIKTIIATVVVAAVGLLYGEAVESILVYGGLLSSVVVVMLTVFPERWDNCIK
jgi:predicted Co/Zn/Cd cation transporter (cation efflux family)